MSSIILLFKLQWYVYNQKEIRFLPKLLDYIKGQYV